MNRAVVIFPLFLVTNIFHVSVACDDEVTIAREKAKRKSEKPKCEFKSHVLCSLSYQIISQVTKLVKFKSNRVRNIC